MSSDFQLTSSKLWRATLGPFSDDPHTDPRARLRNSLLQMRKGVAVLVALIQKDCPGLTIHDVSHLDALWEMADLVAGSDYPLTPAEAFVFGGAVLLHDAGMSTAAFPGGESQIRGTVEWKDSVSFAARHILGRMATDEEFSNPPPEVFEAALFETLRLLHASQAERLASQQWTDPASGDQMHLIQDHHLRLMYASSIGRVAHSHHWSLADVQRKLEKNIGAATELPQEWIVDEVKIACLLRCADIAHVDHRRAPSMLYALMKPKGYSKLHWTFQNRLKKPVFEKDHLFYASGSPFPISESSSWWMCYDALSLIEEELSTTNSLLVDTGRPAFQARRVYAANRPELMAARIRPEGWTPVEAKLRVSDPAHLAITLGGRNLYGKGAFPPVRELLQNAVDAVRARRSLQERPEGWGSVRLSIQKSDAPDSGHVWLHVDDNGVGMSQRILTGALLDFGRSFWTSSEIRDELPGLAGKGFQAVGKFGIGFFSVFLLGSHVRVVSKRYNESDDAARVLEFQSLSMRPLLRPAAPGELPMDISTRVSVRITDPAPLDHVVNRRYPSVPIYGSDDQDDNHAVSIGDCVRSLMCCVDVDFSFYDERNELRFSHSSNWTELPPDQFLDELLSRFHPTERALLTATHAPRLTSLRDSSGRVVGRAALAASPDDRTRRPYGVQVAVGGFVYPGTTAGIPAIGAIEGDTEVAARDRASTRITDASMKNWATEQAKLLDREKFEYRRQIALGRTVLRLGGDSQHLPIIFSGTGMLTAGEFRQILENNEEFYIPLSESYDNDFRPWKITDVPPSFFLHAALPTVLIFPIDESVPGFGRDISLDLKKNYPVDVTKRIDLLSVLGGGRDLTGPSSVLGMIEAIWGSPFSVEFRRSDLYGKPLEGLRSEYWVLRLWKDRP